MAVRRKRVEQTARELLGANQVNHPPIPVDRIAKRQGLLLRAEPLESSLSGFLYRAGDRAVVGTNSLQPQVRQRFTVAHELGHFMLHEVEELHVDRQVHFKLRSKLSSQGTDDDEIEANLFAAEILMPRDMIANDVRRLGAIDVIDDKINALAQRYRVSVQAMTLRLRDLGYIER
jgi:Zn-dependent peptidase ImmA (M78 family)